MSGGRRFVLDTNVFIQAHKAFYSFDTCPGFWHALLCLHDTKQVCSIDKVRSDIIAGKDKLSKWVKDTAPATLFKGTADIRVSDAFGDMVNWVQAEPQFTLEAKAEFSSVADGWLVAYAKANGLVVVTHEEYAPSVKKKVPIPNVCMEFDVECCNTFDMLRELRVRLVLSKRR